MLFRGERDGLVARAYFITLASTRVASGTRAAHTKAQLGHGPVGEPSLAGPMARQNSVELDGAQPSCSLARAGAGGPGMK